MLSQAISGCDDSSRACNRGGCHEHADAGDSGSIDALPACPAMRFCPHVKAVQPVTMLFLGEENRGNVYLGNAVYTPLGPVVTWVTLPQLPGEVRRAGAALIDSQKVVSFDDQAAPDDTPRAPVAFLRQKELGLLVAPFDRVIPVPLETFEAGTPIALPAIGPQQDPPAALGIGQALGALIEPGPTLSFFDASLSERLRDVPLENDGRMSTLTATCNGLLGTWRNFGALRAAAFDNIGNPKGPIQSVDFEPLSWMTGAAWDGHAVVMPGTKDVIELDNSGQVLARTPLTSPPLDSTSTMKNLVQAAFTSDDGILAVTNYPDRLLVLERGTGAMLQSFEIDFGGFSAGLVVATSRWVYFLSTGGYEDPNIYSVLVECGE